MADVLFVLTGSEHWTLRDGTRHPTGFWAEQFTVPYQALTNLGHQVTVATPGGVLPPVDGGSLAPSTNGGLAGADQMTKAVATNAALKSPIDLAAVDIDRHDAVFYPGGHGPMEDLATDPVSGRFLTAALDSGKPLALVCHGPAAVLTAVRPDGRNAFADRQLTAFTNAEEAQAGFANRACWLLQDRLEEVGVDFEEGEAWLPHVSVDGNLITGQNASSITALTAELLAVLPAAAVGRQTVRV